MIHLLCLVIKSYNLTKAGFELVTTFSGLLRCLGSRKTTSYWLSIRFSPSANIGQCGQVPQGHPELPFTNMGTVKSGLYILPDYKKQINSEGFT